MAEKERDNGERRRTNDTWMGRAEMVVWFVNKVGLATFLVLIFTALVIGVYTGKLQSPFLTSARSEEMYGGLATANAGMAQGLASVVAHMERSNELHLEQLRVISKLRCDMKPGGPQQLKCYQDVH